MRLLGGSDLHAENVIAEGSGPVIVDCETCLHREFPRPHPAMAPPWIVAGELLGRTVLSVGLRTGTWHRLGWHGVDASAVGMCRRTADAEATRIVDPGSDEAHVGLVDVEAPKHKTIPVPDLTSRLLAGSTARI